MTDRSPGFDRDARSAERDEAARARDARSDLRDAEGAARDAEAGDREQAARGRDRATWDGLWAQRRDSSADAARAGTAPGRGDEHDERDAEAAYEQAMVDLAVAESGSEWARLELARVLDELADERESMDTERRAAEQDRRAGRSDRQAAAADRRAALADRVFSAAARDQAEIDAQLDPSP